MSDHRLGLHLPGRHAIDAYGNGGFRFGDMSHRGSILCLPTGVYAWDGAIDAAGLAPVLAEAGPELSVLLIGTGPRLVQPDPALRFALRARGIGLDVMDTGSAARTYNILMAERRPVAAALVACG